MNKLDGLIKEGIYNSPLVLLSIKDNKLIEEINNYLPYSTGFEIECNYKGRIQFLEFDNIFRLIPNIIHVQCDINEQRFRIPNGLNGFICLYNISEQLKIHSELNLDSGIHYHIDMTDCYNKIKKRHIEENKDWILEELDKWNYQGTYNSRDITFNSDSWLRFSNEHKTAEFRLGEMTFDYSLLIKRIIHCNNIVKKLKEQLGFTNITYEEPNVINLLDYYKNSSNKLDDKLLNQLKELEEPKIKIITNQEMKETINKRIFKVI